MSFFTELKRRNVFRVGVAYAIVSWMLIQVTDIVAPALNLPEWTLTFIIYLLIIGFPLALFLAWVYELTPEGIKQTESVAPEESITRLTGRKLDFMIIGLMAAAIGILVVDNYVLIEDRGQESEVRSEEVDERSEAGGVRNDTTAVKSEEGGVKSEGTTSTPTTPQPELLPDSIAVLPFENLSPNPDDAYFAAGLHEEVLNQLVKLKNLNVIARTTMRQYAGTEKTIREIANELNVKTVMEGSVRFAGDRIRVTTQLNDSVTGAHLWSETYEHEFRDIFAIESDIAMNVANAMAIEFSLEEQARVEKIPTDSPEAYALYLEAQALYSRQTQEDLTNGFEIIDRALEVDPEFALGWAFKSRLHYSSQIFFAGRVHLERAAGETAARRALEIEPELPEAHSTLAQILASRGAWREAEEEGRKAIALGGHQNEFFRFVTGHIQASEKPILDARNADPLNSTANFNLFVLYECLGRTAASDSVYERGRELFSVWPAGRFNRWTILLGRGEHELAKELIHRDFSTDTAQFFLQFYDSPDNLKEMIQNLYAGTANADANIKLFVAINAAYFGEQRVALRALIDSVDAFAMNVYVFWMPLFKQVRQLDDFKDYMRDIGLVAYWREYGWPDLCRPIGDDDFRCE